MAVSKTALVRIQIDEGNSEAIINGVKMSLEDLAAIQEAVSASVQRSTKARAGSEAALRQERAALIKSRSELAGNSTEYAKMTVRIRQVDAELVDLTGSINASSKAMQDDMAGSAGIAGAAATELGRTISDLPFGITAVTNNISQLGNMFALLVTSAGSVKRALVVLRKTLTGPVGILIAFQAVVAGIEFFAQSQRKAKKDVEETTKALDLQAAAVENLATSFDISKLVQELDFLTGDEGAGKSMNNLKKRLSDVVDFLIDKSPEFKKAFETLTPDEQSSVESLQRLVKEYGNIIKAREIIKGLNEEREKELAKEEDEIDTGRIAKLEADILDAELSLMNRVRAFTTNMSEELDTPIDSFYEFGKDALFQMDKGFFDALKEQGGAFFDPELADLDPDSIAYVDILEEEGEKALLQEFENNEKLRKERERAAKEKLDIEIATINALADIKMGEADIVESVFRTIADVSKNSRLVQALALVGESAAGIAKIIIDTKAANAALTLQQAASINPAFIALLQKRKIFNNIAAKAGIAANIGATATALAKLKAPAGAPSAGSVGTEAAGPATDTAPSFNIVGASGRNQLAEAINALQQTPMKTYVVSSDVTTAQQLDRSIIQGASI